MRLSLLAVFALCASSLAARASVIYSYVGPNYTTVIAPFTTSERVTGSFTLANALTPNQTGQNATPLSYSFFDGVDTFSSTNSYLLLFDSFGTDSTGNINQFRIGINANTGSASIALLASGGNRYNAANDNGSGFAQVSAANNFTTSAPVMAATPEPSSFVLLGTGALGLVKVARKRFAQALS